MPFFDFIDDLPRYRGIEAQQADRLNLRRRFIIQPVLEEIRDARILDLASHDGRWPFAFAGAGARQIVGLEGRQALIDSFADFPRPRLKSRIELHCTDIFEGMEAALEVGEKYDVIAVLGVFYHIMDHQRLLRLIRQIGPKLVIIDSEFSVRTGPIIQLVKERTDLDINAIPEFEGQEIAVKGVPSFPAMELMADAMEYDLTWHDHDTIPRGRRGPIADYYRKVKMRRATCFLRPRP